MVQPIEFTEYMTALAGYVTPADQAQHVLVTTGEGKVHQFTLQGQHMTSALFARLDGSVIYAVTGYATADNIQHVVVVNVDGTLYHLLDHAQHYVTCFKDVMVSAMAGYITPDSIHHVFVATSEDDIYHLAFSEGQEATQDLLAHVEVSLTSLSAYFVSAASEHHLVVASSDGNLYDYTVVDQQKIQPRLLGFFEEKYVSMASYVLPTDNSLHVIPATRDGKLYHVSYQTQMDKALQTDVLGRFYLVSSSSVAFLTAYAQADGLQHLVIAAGDGTIHHFTFRGSPKQQLHLTPDALERQQKEISHEILTTFSPLF